MVSSGWVLRLFWHQYKHAALVLFVVGSLVALTFLVGCGGPNPDMAIGELCGTAYTNDCPESLSCWPAEQGVFRCTRDCGDGCPGSCGPSDGKSGPNVCRP